MFLYMLHINSTNKNFIFFQMRSTVQVRNMQRLQLHTSILDPGGSRILSAVVGEYPRPTRFPLGVPRVGLYRVALLPASEVIRHDRRPASNYYYYIIVIERYIYIYAT